MSALRTLQVLYTCYLAKPNSDRVLYRTILQNRARKILELGIGTGSRAKRLIWLAQRYHAPHSVCYVGLDPFEARTASDGPGVALKLAYRMLRTSGASVRLLPGEPLAVLAEAANTIGTVDLAIFSARVAPTLLAETWFYVPRLLHPQSEVFVETGLPGGRRSIRRVEPDEIAAVAATRRRAA